jgi:maleylpyruvate isomerase
MGSTDTAARLGALRASTADLLTGLGALEWADEDMRAPTALPDWTRGHVLTHLGRNADGIAATLAGALRGEIVARYPNGPEGRAADIEAGSGRGAVALLADVRESAARLDRVFGAVAEADGWELPSDNDRPARGWINNRWREVEIHRVDLLGPYGPADWPAGFVGYLLPRLADPARLTPRVTRALRIEVASDGSTTTDLGGTVWTADPNESGEPVVVAGPDWAVLGWLLGRPALVSADLTATPELGQWS